MDYILIVPQGFTDDFLNGGTMQLQQAAVPDGAAGVYTDQLVNQYLRLLTSYRTLDPSLSLGEEMCIRDSPHGGGASPRCRH